MTHTTDDLQPDTLWRHYQRGYKCLVLSGVYFRQLLRPALSHAFFLRAVPLLTEYARANRGDGDLSPGFGDQMHACLLTPRDLLHLDYAICLGCSEAGFTVPAGLGTIPPIDWPSLASSEAGKPPTDAAVLTEPASESDETDDTDDEAGGPDDPSTGHNPPFDA